MLSCNCKWGGAFLILVSCGGTPGSSESATDAATVDALAEGGSASAPDAPIDDAAAAWGATCDGAAVPIAGGDGGTTAEDAGGFFVAVLKFSQGSCLPGPLPVSAPGQVECRILYALPSSDVCAAHAGLSEAPADVAASVRAKEGLDSSQSLCVLAQLPLTDWVCGSCAASSAAGWCYVIGPAAGQCPQTLVASPAVAMPAGATSFLACGAPPPLDGGTPSPR